MSTPSAKMTVLVGDRFACVKISGRANFTSSIDFRTLFNELRVRGVLYFVLDLSECMLMDSTFLGVLAGIGLRMNQESKDHASPIELLNPNPRIAELLDNLGVLHLFKVTQGPVDALMNCELLAPAPGQHTREETTRACLEAHETLMALNPENAARFKDVAQFLAEDLKRLKAQ